MMISLNHTSVAAVWSFMIPHGSYVQFNESAKNNINVFDEVFIYWLVSANSAKNGICLDYKEMRTQGFRHDNAI